jgi:hypothetical protein
VAAKAAQPAPHPEQPPQSSQNHPKTALKPPRNRQVAAEVFPTDVRATFQGVSAAWGKVRAAAWGCLPAACFGVDQGG